jgi:hypothetical protein
MLERELSHKGSVVRLDDTLEIGHMALKRMDNVGIVVDDREGTIDFFRELGLELKGRATIDGEWAGRVTGPDVSLGWAISASRLP